MAWGIAIKILWYAMYPTSIETARLIRWDTSTISADCSTLAMSYLTLFRNEEWELPADKVVNRRLKYQIQPWYGYR
jgi:hypothetical protein